MPPKKMVITQNLLFNVPLAFIMNLVSTLTNPNGKFDFTFIPMFLIGLLFGGQLSQFPRAYVMALPPMLITSYVCVLIFMPLSMKLSGLGRFIAGHQGK